MAPVPDLLIEKRRNGWGIILHPPGGEDPAGFVFIHKSGRMYCVPENSHTPIVLNKTYDEVDLLIHGE